MKTYADIIELWDTAEGFAADVGISGTLARLWKMRNKIPDHAWLAVVSAAERRGFEVTLQLLAELSVTRRKSA